jgi:hypothetical protein
MSDDLVQRAVAQAKAGNRDEARKLATQVIRTNPDNVAAWVVMAQVVKDRKQAIDCLENVLRLEPGHPWATIHLGRLKGESQAPAKSTPSRAPEPDPGESGVISMKDLRQRASSTADIDLSDLGDFVQAPPPAATKGGFGMSLDPLAGTEDWKRPMTETGDFSYSEVRDEMESLRSAGSDKPVRKRRTPWLLFIVVFLLFLVVALVAGAWALDMISLPFLP